MSILALVALATLGLLVSLMGVISMANQQKQGSVMVSIGIFMMIMCIFLKKALA